MRSAEHFIKIAQSKSQPNFLTISSVKHLNEVSTKRSFIHLIQNLSSYNSETSYKNMSTRKNIRMFHPKRTTSLSQKSPKNF